MAGQIFHEWNGTVLTITSDSGTSSADLKGVGEMGPRGPQGPAGVSVGEGGNVDVDLSNYYTKDETYSKTEVDNKIAEAQLGGEDIDLSGYRKKTDNEFADTLTITNENGTMHIFSNGIQGADNSLWIGGDGEGCFTDLKVGTVGNYKPVATQEWVAAQLAALDGSEVEY